MCAVIKEPGAGAGGVAAYRKRAAWALDGATIYDDEKVHTDAGAAWRTTFSESGATGPDTLMYLHARGNVGYNIACVAPSSASFTMLVSTFEATAMSLTTP